MKTSIIAALTMSVAISATAQEPSDTIQVVNNVHSLTVTESPSGSTITIIGQGSDNDYYFSQTTSVDDPNAPEQEDWGLSLPFLRSGKTPSKSKIVWLDQLYFGISHPLSAPVGVDQSIECGFGQIIAAEYTPWRKGPSFAIGVGLHYEQYCLHHGLIFGKEGSALTLNSLGEGETSPSSRLRNFGFTVPITITQTIYKEFAVSIGATLQFNTDTRASSSFYKDDIKYTRDFKGLQQRIMSYNLYAAIGFRDDVGLYVRYNPLSLFRTGDGPRFETISFGITFGL